MPKIPSEHLNAVLESLRGSFWAIPMVLMALSVVVALLNFRFDTHWIPASRFSDLQLISPFEWQTLRNTLSTTASGFLGVAGVSFSITIASLTLASQQFGPRLIGTFMNDRFIQTVLGFFVATFMYCILLMQLITTDTSESNPPAITALTLLLLTFVDLFLLVIFIHRICIAIQADSIIADVCDELQQRATNMYPESILGVNRSSYSEAESQAQAVRQLEQEPISLTVQSAESGYIQSVDYSELLKIAEKQDLQIAALHRAGDYLVGKTDLFNVRGEMPADGLDGQLLQDLVVLGRTRTPMQDSEFSIKQLVEIALRALSPGINDPITAMTCIDRLGSCVVVLADAALPQKHVYDARGELRLVLNVSTFEGLVQAAFNQIRQAAGGHIDIQIRLLEILGKTIRLIDDESKKSALFDQAKMLYAAADFDALQPADEQAIRERFDKVEQLMVQGT